MVKIGGISGGTAAEFRRLKYEYGRTKRHELDRLLAAGQIDQEFYKEDVRTTNDSFLRELLGRLEFQTVEEIEGDEKAEEEGNDIDFRGVYGNPVNVKIRD